MSRQNSPEGYQSFSISSAQLMITDKQTQPKAIQLFTYEILDFHLHHIAVVFIIITITAITIIDISNCINTRRFFPLPKRAIYLSPLLSSLFFFFFSFSLFLHV
ncbi:hypothetical protein DFH27DRAFT_566230 [Peziza echinospora]|nr:hypothetical protein DFH27DRAFT_566230 [Peziza echinospora]